MKNIPVLTTGPTGKTKTYSSIRAAARALSGTGKVTKTLNQVHSAVKSGGGLVGRMQVTAA